MEQQIDPWVRRVAGLSVVVGVALRLFTTSPMWLDEALTVNIASGPLSGLRDRLAQDGAPPLYYVLLSLWMDVVGSSDVAVRLLSALFSIATIALVFRMGKRLGGERVALAAAAIVATSPFAIRYATEARMYSLVALLVAAGWLALSHAIDEGRTIRQKAWWSAATGACAGLLLLTHYWGFYLLGAVGVALLARAVWRPATRADSIRAAVAIASGSLAIFAPWVGTFLYQLAHTGTPWGAPPGPVEVAFTTLVDLGGGPYPEGQAVAAVVAALVVLALLGAAVGGTRVELELRTRPGVRAEFAVAVAAVLAGVAAGLLTDSAWASRYTSVVFPLVILVTAFGVRALASDRLVAGLLVVLLVLGAAGGVRNMLTPRTQAERAVEAIVAAGGGDSVRRDLVVYCPDQLGPAVERLLPDGVEQLTFPDLENPRLVDWVDYEERMEAADPVDFAGRVLDRAQGRDIFYVWMPGYRTLDEKCEGVNDALGNARSGNRRLLDPRDGYFERQVVWLHPAAG